MNPAPRIQVLCVDDHPIVRQGVATLLSIEPDMAVVAQAENGREAVVQFRAHRPDITLMDLQMPGMSGLDAIRAIRAEFPDARIIVLTTYVGDAQVQQALQAGAQGYLLKNALHKELLDAIRAVHAGHKALPSNGSYELAGQIEGEALTPAEISVLKFIAEGNAYPEIAQTLALSSNEVEQQVRGILSKLDVQEQARADAKAPDGEVVEAERAARHAAEAANRAKSQFLASMSHELRTPLTAILGYAQLLTMEGGLTARQVRGLDTINQSGQHLLALISDILDLARIEAGRTDLNPEPVQLGTLLQTVVNLMCVKADEKHLAFSFQPAPGLPEAVLADERRLRQVLLNLLSNAIKFTDLGTITLRAAAEPDGPSGVTLRLEVEDTGVGMHPEELVRIFKPFEQVGDLQRRKGGTGLGLAITRALVNDMGGQVQVNSDIGRGTRFVVELPLPVVSRANDEPLKSSRLGRYQGPARRVLVIDDVATNRALLCDFLSSIGLNAVELGAGDELLSIARRLRPHLILMDSVTPTMGGMEAVRRLRKEADLATVPVIAVSASATAEHRATCLQAGVNVFLTKPVSLDTLQTQVGEQLGLHWTPSTAGKA